jgi:hypothetical protein
MTRTKTPVEDASYRKTILKGASYDKSSLSCLHTTRYFWYFWLTIQNTANRQVRNLFLKVSWLYLSRFPGALCAPTPPRPPILGEGKYQKEKSPEASGVGAWTCLLVHGRDGGGVCYKLAAMCGSAQLC